MNHLVHSPTSGDQDMYSVLFGVSLDGSVWCPYPCLRKQWFLISSRKSWRHNLAVPEHVSQKSKTRGRCPESSWKQELALRQLQIQACLYTCLKQIPPGLSLMLTVCGTRSRHEGSIPALYRTLVPCSCMSIFRSRVQHSRVYLAKTCQNHACCYVAQLDLGFRFLVAKITCWTCGSASGFCLQLGTISLARSIQEIGPYRSCSSCRCARWWQQSACCCRWATFRGWKCRWGVRSWWCGAYKRGVSALIARPLDTST